MPKIAILMPGNLDCYKVSIDSVMKNLVEPNNADVFILASRTAYLKTVNENLGGPLHKLLVTEADERTIHDCLGDRLKALAYTDDIPDYEEEIAKQIAAVHERISWVNDTGKFIQFYDRENKCLYSPRMYLDRFLKMKYLVKMLEKHEAENDIKYDWILRARIDFIYDDVIFCVDEIVNKIKTFIRYPEENGVDIEQVKESLYWDGLDALWFGTPKVAKFLLSNFIETIGSYAGGTITDVGDYRLDRNYQVNMLVKEIPFDTKFAQVNLAIGATISRKGVTIFIPNYPVVDRIRREKKISLEDYYKSTKDNPIHYRIPDESRPGDSKFVTHLDGEALDVSETRYGWAYTYYEKSPEKMDMVKDKWK